MSKLRNRIFGSGGVAVITAALALSTHGASAAETICYEYDVHGKIIKVIRSGPDNNCATTSDNVTTEYEYDAADNRTKKETTGAPP
ncbi:MAG: hypothetical protein AAFX54_04865 [Pseudomonadota bacterium]